MAQLERPQDRNGFEIAIICALPIERDAVEALIEEEYEVDGFSYGKAPGDTNAYTTGRLGNQHVVLAYMPGMGMISAAGVVSTIRASFERIKVGIVVGICGGVPRTPNGSDILLGDVIISTSIVQIDFGRQHENKFVRKKGVEDILGRANPEIRTFVGRASGHLVQRRLQEKTNRYTAQLSSKDGMQNSEYPGPKMDHLYPTDYRHKHRGRRTCSICDNCRGADDEVCDLALEKPCASLGCDEELLVERQRLQRAMGYGPDGRRASSAEIKEAQKAAVHFGRIACSNQVMKSGVHRDRIAEEEEVIGFEMEGAGTWDYLPTIVIKSVCDYADSHKNKIWQQYAAATAAACTKAFLEEWRSSERPIPVNTVHSSPSSQPSHPSQQNSRIAFYLPFRRDTDFVDRGSLLDQIHERCSMRGCRTALVGLGGVGKSQLAIEYCYRVREQSPDTWIFWVHASNAARFEQSFLEIADQVDIPERQNPQANIFKLVHDWLRNVKNGKWFLVLDNVDDARFLLEPPFPRQASRSRSREQQRDLLPLREYIPQSPNGSILITSRTRHAALALVDHTEIIPVEPMDEAHAIALIDKKLGKENDHKDIAELAATLEYMPLAIIQAAAYISQRAPRCSVRQYLEKFQRSDKSKTALLNHEGGHLQRDRESKNSILIAWQISFDHIRRTRRSAADLLSLMSFFDRQGIPESLIRNHTIKKTRRRGGKRRRTGYTTDSDVTESESEMSDSDEFEEDVLLLRNYSFISVKADTTTTFEMHALVQLAMREWLSVSGALEGWKEQYIRNLRMEFPAGRYENWPKCQELFPHVKSAMSQQPKDNKSVREWAAVLYNAAWYAWERGNIADADRMSVAAMKAREQCLGPEHTETIDSMTMVCLAYRLGGRWKEAEDLEIESLEIGKRVFGLDNPRTLTIMANLASTYSNQGRWKEAEELEVDVFEASKKVLGEEHPETLTSMSNLASTYDDLGRWKEAEELELQAMEMRKRVHGAEHPRTLISMNNLALTYSHQGRWKEAEDLEVQAMQLSKKILGIEHPDTLTSMYNLAFTWKRQSRFEEAMELMQQCLRLSERTLGLNHPSTISAATTLSRWRSKDSKP